MDTLLSLSGVLVHGVMVLVRMVKVYFRKLFCALFSSGGLIQSNSHSTQQTFEVSLTIFLPKVLSWLSSLYWVPLLPCLSEPW